MKDKLKDNFKVEELEQRYEMAWSFDYSGSWGEVK